MAAGQADAGSSGTGPSPGAGWGGEIPGCGCWGHTVPPGDAEQGWSRRQMVPAAPSLAEAAGMPDLPQRPRVEPSEGPTAPTALGHGSRCSVPGTQRCCRGSACPSPLPLDRPQLWKSGSKLGNSVSQQGISPGESWAKQTGNFPFPLLLALSPKVTCLLQGNPPRTSSTHPVCGNPSCLRESLLPGAQSTSRKFLGPARPCGC